MVAVGNGPSVGSGTSLTRTRRPGDSQVDVLISGRPGRWPGCSTPSGSGFATHHQREDVTYLRGSRVSVSGGPFWCSADGEVWRPRAVPAPARGARGVPDAPREHRPAWNCEGWDPAPGRVARAARDEAATGHRDHGEVSAHCARCSTSEQIQQAGVPEPQSHPDEPPRRRPGTGCPRRARSSGPRPGVRDRPQAQAQLPGDLPVVAPGGRAGAAGPPVVGRDVVAHAEYRSARSHRSSKSSASASPIPCWRTSVRLVDEAERLGKDRVRRADDEHPGRQVR